MNQKKPTNRPAGQSRSSSQSSRPASPKPAKAAKPKQPGAPGDGLFGWFGRQVGHVKKAVQTDVTKPAGKKQAGAARQASAAKPKAAASAKPRPNASVPPPRTAPPPASAANGGTVEKIIYRQDQVEEAELPDRPGVILRRTIIDEVVVEREEPGDKS